MTFIFTRRFAAEFAWKLKIKLKYMRKLNASMHIFCFYNRWRRLFKKALSLSFVFKKFMKNRFFRGKVDKIEKSRQNFELSVCKSSLLVHINFCLLNYDFKLVFIFSNCLFNFCIILFVVGIQIFRPVIFSNNFFSAGC